MKRYSKPLGKLLDYKQAFFESNSSKLKDAGRIASVYKAQPRRHRCKNCDQTLSFSPSESFTQLGVTYCFCSLCGHCNGAHDDTDQFGRRLYTRDLGKNYATGYWAKDIEQYNRRRDSVYLPKAEFLKEALAKEGESPCRLTDFGAGAGYFVSAALKCGFKDVKGYEVSETLVAFGNEMMNDNRLAVHDHQKIVELVKESNAPVASFIGVLEHLKEPREVLAALADNEKIKYIFFSVPLFSPTVVVESVFKEVCPRHLVAGHTHLYTEESIQHFCDEFGFQRLSEWWFGLDICDLFRSVCLSLPRADTEQTALQAYWNNHFKPLIDDLQHVLDKARTCSEVHILLGKEYAKR